MANTINRNKANNSTLVTIPIKAVTTKSDANAVIEHNRAIIRDYVEKKLGELGLSWPICDLGCGLFPLHNENPYDDIVNIANYVQCAYMDAWGFFFKYVEARRELAEMKGRKIEDVKCVEVER